MGAAQQAAIRGASDLGIVIISNEAAQKLASRSGSR